MDNIWGSQTKGEKEGNSKSENSGLIETTGNHIYFYSDVDDESIINLNKSLQETVRKIVTQGISYGLERPEIHLHINSHGGSVFAGISAMENIIRLKKEAKIITHTEGISASAATFISIVGEERIIYPHSYMLIHQIRAFYGGTYDNMQDNMKNLDELMDFLRGIYKQYTKVPEESLDEILKHDIYFNAEKCIEYNLADRIFE